MAKDRSPNRRRSYLELTPDQQQLLNGLAPGSGDELNDRFKRIAEQLEAACGLRGDINLASDLHMEENLVREVSDPVEDTDAVNLRTLKKLLRCENLVNILEECWEYSELLDDVVESTPGAALSGSFDFIVAGRLYVPSTLTTGTSHGTANTVVVFLWVLPFDFTVTKFVIENTNAVASKFFAGGIYNSLGQLVLDSGPQSTAVASRKTITPSSPVKLAAGNYYLAHTSNDTTAQIRKLQNAQTHQNILNNNKARAGTAANASVAGQLPSSLGTITAFNTTTLGPPIMMLLEA
jgi:hypothetical protein